MNTFNNVCTAIFGDHDWKPAAADALGVSLRNVQYWAAGAKDIPAGVWADLLDMVMHAKTETVERLARLDRARDDLQNIHT